MAALVFQEMPWHEGEKTMHELMHVPSDLDNPTVPYLSPGAASMLERSPLLAVGTLDEQGRPWTALWGGEAGFARGLPGSHFALKVAADGKYDPVIQALLGGEDAPHMSPEETQTRLQGKLLSALAIDLETRRRVKLFGKPLMGCLREVDSEEAHKGKLVEIQLVGKIDQSLGNCPKYLNSKHILPASSQPTCASDSPSLTEEAKELISQADLFFVSSSSKESKDLDTNHRGGPNGFVRLLDNDAATGSTRIVWPEYSGNRLYQTLGNLVSNPVAGLIFPNFDTGDVLYVTGETEVLVGSKAAALVPKANLAVVMTITAAKHVKEGLFYRAKTLSPSPYNPAVWKTTQESSTAAALASDVASLPKAKLLSREMITSDLARFRFAFEDADKGARYKSGQWVAFDLSDELYTGYSHMRDSDPLSINDDFVRTFTVSSHPSKLPSNEFEITIRKVGRVTGYLFDVREGRIGELQVPVRGFGGEFKVVPKSVQANGRSTGFVAGGIGITPLLSASTDLTPDQLTIVWTLQSKDLPLALDVLDKVEHLATSFTLHVTGNITDEASEHLKTVQDRGARIERRRLQASDLTLDGIDKWFVCTSPGLRKAIIGWLADREVVYEDFNF